MKIFQLIAPLLLLGGTVFAQPAPHLAYVYPAGGKAGSTFQMTVGGQNLMTVSNAFVTGSGVSVTVVDHTRPMNNKVFNELRDQLKALQEKFQAARKGGTGTNAWTAADTRERDDIRAKILKNPPNRNANAAMIDTVIIRVAIATNAEPGEREIRLATATGLSNPMKFCLGTLPEISRTAAKPDNPDLDKYIEKMGGKPAPAGTPKYEASVKLPATVNGQIMPGGVDRYRFFATRGQQLIIAANARSLIPYLADAVPGWFEATLTLTDAKGREVASAERYRFRPDPVIHFTVPNDGEYTVEIHDSIFRGREDFVYRLTLGELPFITGIFPLGGQTGEKTSVTLTGWNLPAKQLTLDNSPMETGVTTLAGEFANAVPFAVDSLPEILAHEPNHSTETAQAVKLPVIINGRIERPGQPVVFKFSGRGGQKIVAEIMARRLDSPLDSCLRLTDASGQQLAFNDDFEDKGTGLETHHADSYLTATLPAEGTYFVHLTDTQGQGGPEFAYRLRLSEPQPDFDLRVVPSSLSLRTGMSAPVTVFVLRRDGFTNAINLDLAHAPRDFSLSGARIAENQEKGQFTLKAPAQGMERPVAISLEGHALIGGKLVSHLALPADDLMQAFIYRHLVPAQELAVTVVGPARPFFARDLFKVISATPVKIPAGGRARVQVSAPAQQFSGKYDLQLDNPPDGIALTNIVPNATGFELVFTCDAEKLKPGTTGNLICEIVPKALAKTNSKKTGNAGQNGSAATLPAIPFKIVTQ